MSATTCPSCGKPLRPGAKFCGSCGAVLSGAARPRSAAEAQPGDIPCPYCGRPVRPTAKFCGNCGKEIQSARTEGSVAQTAPAGGAANSAHPSANTVRAPRSRGVALGLAAAGLIACVLLAAAGIFAVNRRGLFAGVFGGRTATPTSIAAIAATDTETATSMTTFTSVPPTTAAATSVPTTTAAPTSVPTTTAPAPAITATTPLSPTISLTPQLSAPDPPSSAPPASPTAEGVAVTLVSGTLFEDKFDGQLSGNWVSWGPVFPAIEQGFNDRWLSLRADDLVSGGVTTGEAMRVFNAPGVVIEFEGQLDPSFRGYVIAMDWDQEDTRRNAGYNRPGLIRVEVRSEAAVLSTLLSAENCLAPVDGTQSHVYRLEILAGQAVSLFIDGSQTANCNITNMGIAPLPGKLSFSGLGWVTRVKVAQGPPQ